MINEDILSFEDPTYDMCIFEDDLHSSYMCKYSLKLRKGVYFRHLAGQKWTHDR